MLIAAACEIVNHV